MAAQSRRQALQSTTAGAVAFGLGLGQAQDPGRKVRLAVVGGGFGAMFFWHEHPNCAITAVTDLHSARRERLRQVYRCDNVHDSLEEMLRKSKDFDAVAVFSGAPDHYKHVSMCFDRGLHVLSAVPACNSLEEAEKLKSLKKRTGLRYMMAESTYYRDGCRYARELFRQGGFGELFYTEAEYYHDGNIEQMLANPKSLLYSPDGKPSWRQNQSPMHYPTHSVSFLVGVTGERITEVSCLGWGDRKLLSKVKARDLAKSPFSNETALMRTSGGHALRCNEFRQVASIESERAQWFGEKGTLYMAKTAYHGDVWHPRYGKPQPVELPKYWQSERLPEKMRHTSHHGNSATWISAEFIDALVENREPEIGLEFALGVTVPGIVAHQSALKNGEQMKVPDFSGK